MSSADSGEINMDALDGPFQEHNLKTTLRFEADSKTPTIIADTSENQIIKIESQWN